MQPRGSSHQGTTPADLFSISASGANRGFRTSSCRRREWCRPLRQPRWISRQGPRKDRTLGATSLHALPVVSLVQFPRGIARRRLHSVGGPRSPDHVDGLQSKKCGRCLQMPIVTVNFGKAILNGRSQVERIARANECCMRESVDSRCSLTT